MKDRCKEKEDKNKMASEKLSTLFAKLNNGNYAQWSFKMKMVLIRDGLWKVINTEKPALDLTWDASDQKAFATIVLGIGDDQIVLVKKEKTAKEVWEVLRAYHQKSSLSSQVALLKKLYKAELKKDGDLKAHMQQIFEWFDELREIGCEEEEHKAILILLASLNDDYRAIVTALEGRDVKTLKLSDVRIKLMEEYDRGKTGVERNEALRTGSSFKRDGTNSGECYFCGEQGHMKRYCKSFAKWLEDKKKRTNEESSYEGSAKTMMTHERFKSL